MLLRAGRREAVAGEFCALALETGDSHASALGDRAPAVDDCRAGSRAPAVEGRPIIPGLRPGSVFSTALRAVDVVGADRSEATFVVFTTDFNVRPGLPPPGFDVMSTEVGQLTLHKDLERTKF